MKPSFSLTLLAFMIGFVTPGFAQLQSKFMVVDVDGADSIVLRGDKKIENVTDGMVKPANGSVLRTGDASTVALLLSNSTGVTILPKTEVKISKFDQAPFAASPTDLDREPSISALNMNVAKGTVCICKSIAAAGSNFSITTPHANFNVRGERLEVVVGPDYTQVNVLQGDVTLQTETGGKVVAAGNWLRISPNATTPFTWGSNSDPDVGVSSDAVSEACMARKSVFFDVGGTKESPELKPVAVLSPINGNTPVVSPSKMY